MKKPKLKKASRAGGRPRSGERGAEQLALEMASMSSKVGSYLDKRPDRSKSISASELKRHLYVRALNMPQAKRALLSALLDGRIGADPTGKLFDARSLVTGTDDGSDIANLKQLTIPIAEKLVKELVDRHKKDEGFSSRLGQVLSRKIEKLPAKLGQWARHDLESTGGERRERIALEAAQYRDKVAAWFDEVREREASGIWHNASADAHAAAIVRTMTRTTGRVDLSLEALAPLHKAAVKSIATAAEFGVDAVQLRRSLDRDWEGLRKISKMWSRDCDRDREIMVGVQNAIRLLVSRRSLLEHLRDPKEGSELWEMVK